MSSGSSIQRGNRLFITCPNLTVEQLVPKEECITAWNACQLPYRHDLSIHNMKYHEIQSKHDYFSVIVFPDSFV
jgi:hypothetical protein